MNTVYLQLKAPVMNRTVALAIAIVLSASAAGAADHQVLMLNKGEHGAMVFQPSLIEAAPGDTVTFVPVDKGHDAESVRA